MANSVIATVELFHVVLPPRREHKWTGDELAAVQLGIPVHTLLGGAVRTRIPITHSLGLIPLEDAEKEAVKVVSEGIRTIKIKVGVDPERDVAIVKRVRAAVGASTDL